MLPVGARGRGLAHHGFSRDSLVSHPHPQSEGLGDFFAIGDQCDFSRLYIPAFARNFDIVFEFTNRDRAFQIHCQASQLHRSFRGYFVDNGGDERRWRAAMLH